VPSTLPGRVVWSHGWNRSMVLPTNTAIPYPSTAFARPQFSDV
jgi:hypothetical protein